MKMTGRNRLFFNEKLNWNNHCYSVVKMLQGSFIQVLHTILQVYYCPGYASPLFIGLSLENSTKIKRITKRFHRLLSGHEYRNACLTPLETIQ